MELKKGQKIVLRRFVHECPPTYDTHCFPDEIKLRKDSIVGPVVSHVTGTYAVAWDGKKAERGDSAGPPPGPGCVASSLRQQR